MPDIFRRRVSDGRPSYAGDISTKAGTRQRMVSHRGSLVRQIAIDKRE